MASGQGVRAHRGSAGLRALKLPRLRPAAPEGLRRTWRSATTLPPALLRFRPLCRTSFRAGGRPRGPDVRTSAAPPELLQAPDGLAAGHGLWDLVQFQAALHALTQSLPDLGQVGHGADPAHATPVPLEGVLQGLRDSPAGEHFPDLEAAARTAGVDVGVDWNSILNQTVDYRPLGAKAEAGTEPGPLLAVVDQVASRLAQARDVDAPSFRALLSGTTSLLGAMASSMSRLSLPDQRTVGSAVRDFVAAEGQSSGGLAEALDFRRVASLGASGRGVALLLGASVAVILACLPTNLSGEGGEGTDGGVDTLVAEYNARRLSDFWAGRRASVLRRQAAVGAKAMGLLTSLLVEWRLGTLESNMAALARQCRATIEDLGPAFVKLAQALSTRSDIFPPEFLQEFCGLQDRVPAFDDSAALRALDVELGRPHGAVFEWLSDGPMASASLGQVYHGLLKRQFGGGEVAVKVQRPDIVEGIALDVFLLRRMAAALAMFPTLHSNWSATFDEWARRFFDELDYTKECRNALAFRDQMAKLPGITVPRMYPELTTQRVMTSEWVYGEKLSAATVIDSRATLRTILNCYLIQLLETGFLHADPHPGNILCTMDGKICILDFGLMTEVSKEQRVALIEFIAHLWCEDWEAVAADLGNLDFLPQGVRIDDNREFQVLLERIFGDMVNGGGLRVGRIKSELSRAASDHNLVIPPYFMLILRVFCIIEGVSLSMDDRFAIVGECLPYLARRLLVDKDPKVQETLKVLLYGEHGRLDVERLRKLVSALAAFTTDGSRTEVPDHRPQDFFLTLEERVKGHTPASVGFDGALYAQPGPVFNEAVKETLRTVFSQEGSYAQQLLVDEMVTSVETMSLAALVELFHMVLGSISAFVTLAPPAGRQGGLAAALAPLMNTMTSVPSMINVPVGELTDEDRHILNNARAILGMMEPRTGLAARPLVALSAARDMLPLASELLPGLVSTLVMCAQEFARRRALQLAEDLDPKGRASPGGDAFSSIV